MRHAPHSGQIFRLRSGSTRRRIDLPTLIVEAMSVSCHFHVNFQGGETLPRRLAVVGLGGFIPTQIFPMRMRDVKFVINKSPD